MVAALARATEVLRSAGIPRAHQEARWLLAAHLECDVSALWSLDHHSPLPDARQFATRLAARAQHQPLSRIFARRQFWRAEFVITDAVLDSRPDSEWLIETALRYCEHSPKRILDLGTGSGCLLLSALGEYPNATGLGVDCSTAALAVAKHNATRLNFSTRAEWLCSDWLRRLDAQKFDLILTNPPYIPHHTPLPEAVQKYDPALALFADADGFAAYCKILAALPQVMHPESLAVFECAPDQTKTVAELALNAGLRPFSPLNVNISALHPQAQIGIVCMGM